MKTVTRDGWTLVRAKSKLHVHHGESVASSRGELAMVAGGAPPKHAASTGRVYVIEAADHANGSDYCREYFPSVFNLEWIRTA